MSQALRKMHGCTVQYDLRSRPVAMNFGVELEPLAEVLEFAFPAFFRQQGDIRRADIRTEGHFQNFCYEAVREFGLLLAEEDEEPTLFGTFPHASYFELRGGRLQQSHFDTKGLIYIPPTTFVAVDLTHNMYDWGDRRAAVFHGQSQEAILAALREYYKRPWRAHSILDPKRKVYRIDTEERPLEQLAASV